ncbi:MAG: M15 family metallopeptidase [Bdellovibrionales bacterium]|nr:M15 family metallopeptidase [Bdellovibrionales bacterium]
MACKQLPPELAVIYQELGIAENWAEVRGVVYYPEAAVADLQVVSIDFDGKPFILDASVSDRWNQLLGAAEKDGVRILPFSGFRSYRYQRGLIKRQLHHGRTIDDILTGLAAPGCSEHHTGRAIDLTSECCKPLGEEFENTDAFKWLQTHASRFGLVMSFPRNNEFGYIYEPWHWCFQEDE